MVLIAGCGSEDTSSPAGNDKPPRILEILPHTTTITSELSEALAFLVKGCIASDCYGVYFDQSVVNPCNQSTYTVYDVRYTTIDGTRIGTYNDVEVIYSNPYNFLPLYYDDYDAAIMWNVIIAIPIAVLEDAVELGQYSFYAYISLHIYEQTEYYDSGCGAVKTHCGKYLGTTSKFKLTCTF